MAPFSTRLLMALPIAATMLAAVLPVSPIGAERKLEGPRYLGLSSDRPGGNGGLDVCVYDRLTTQLLPLPALNSAADDTRPILSAGGALLAFTSHRDPKAGSAFLYDVFAQRMSELPGLDKDGAATEPALSADGAVFAFGRTIAASAGASGRNELIVFDRSLGRYMTPPRFNEQAGRRTDAAVSPEGGWFGYVYRNESPAVPGTIVIHNMLNGASESIPAQGLPGESAYPSLSRDARTISFSARAKPEANGWDVFVYDRIDKKLIPTPGLNSSEADERSALSADGRYLALETRRAGSWDILLYDIRQRRFIELPGLNTSGSERHPSLSRE